MSHFDDRNPGMHRSATTDMLYLISRRCVLELDDGSKTEISAGDVVAERHDAPLAQSLRRAVPRARRARRSAYGGKSPLALRLRNRTYSREFQTRRNPPSVTTNGTRLTARQAAEFVRSGVDEIHVSIDGARAAPIESIRIGIDVARVCSRT